MTSGKLDRKIQFQRFLPVDDGYSIVEAWADHGGVVRAQKKDLSDGERWRADEVSAGVTTRFLIRSSTFTRDITPKDRLVCAGVTFEISGIKEGKGRNQWLELTCGSRSDL